MVFVVAEIGVNWDGNFDLVKEMILQAKNVGCDAVKFQAFNSETAESHPEKDRLLKCSITDSNIEKIDELVKSIGIEWFCTPMYPDAVDFLDAYVNRYKIRNADGQNLIKNKPTELIDKVLKTKKEIFVSSQKSPRNSKFFNNPKIKWLYVVPKYPCEISDIDFRNITDFDGYSNHFPHIIAPLTAVVLGSKIIEVHITADKSRAFFDNPVSFDYEQLKELVFSIRLLEKLRR